ncbi:MAG TPA: peptidoglycan DD-metalloendopeptidase family protein [Firmicutes bacterium]|nr:peptidoglycan DD-metalloendopeptidase family protein [Bacillota bacterium]
MLFSKKRKNVSYSDLRSRLEEYSNARERDNKWFFEEGEKDNTAFFESFPLSFVRNMHSYLLFKITLVVLTVVVVFFLSLVKMPFSASVMEKINYITTWKMDFVEIGRVALPVIRGLWEGDLESGLNTPVIVPAISNESKTGFIAPIEGELEKSFGLNYNPALQREEMCYGLVMCAREDQQIRASAAGQAKEIKEHPFYGLYLLLEHPGGMETCYGYLSEVLVEEGEVVEQGQVVAEIKLNPYQNRASFYFEIRDKGEPVDPLPLIIE